MKKIALSLFCFLFFAINLHSQITHTVNFSSEKLILSSTTGIDKVNYTKVVYDDL